MPAWIAPVAMGVGSLISGLISSSHQRKQNQKLAETQASANERYLSQANEYNTPANQMRRFEAAGLNPNLVYSQGNPGNQASPISYPEIGRTDWQKITPEAVQMMNQTSLAQSQVAAQNANTIRTGVMTQLNKLQTEVLAKNPLLDNEGFNAIITGLKATAESKVANSGMDKLRSEWFTGEKSFNIDGVEMHGPAGLVMMEQELKNLTQKFDLGNLDKQIKSQVINSKEFQNAILEVQQKFMTSGDITPQHILQFVQLILMKML